MNVNRRGGGMPEGFQSRIHWRQIGKNEPVALNRVSNGEFDRAIKHRAVKGETVKFPVLAARINSIGQRLQKIVVVFFSGQRRRQTAWINASDLGAQSSGGHLPRQFRCGSAPYGDK